MHGMLDDFKSKPNNQSTDCSPLHLGEMQRKHDKINNIGKSKHTFMKTWLITTLGYFLNALTNFRIIFRIGDLVCCGTSLSKSDDCDSEILLAFPMFFNRDFSCLPLSKDGEPLLQAFFRHRMILMTASATTSGLASIMLRRSQSFWQTPAGTWNAPRNWSQLRLFTYLCSSYTLKSSVAFDYTDWPIGEANWSKTEK